MSYALNSRYQVCFWQQHRCSMMTKKLIFVVTAKLLTKMPTRWFPTAPFCGLGLSASIECLLHKMLKVHINNLNINLEKLYKISSKLQNIYSRAISEWYRSCAVIAPPSYISIIFVSALAVVSTTASSTWSIPRKFFSCKERYVSKNISNFQLISILIS